jgi:hypothetical protein
VLSGLDQKTTVSKSWQLAAMPLRNNRSDHWIRSHPVLVSAELTRFYQKPTRVCVCVCVCVCVQGWGGGTILHVRSLGLHVPCLASRICVISMETTHT